VSTKQKAPKTGKDRIRGVESHIDDLVLTHGGELPLNVGVAEVPSPTLKRTLSGADTIEIPVFDPDRRLLRNLLSAQKFDAELDGVHFRYPGGMSKSGDTLTLTLEDRWIALLREKEGPKRAKRSKVTRAEFIKSLVEEACPGLEFVCPQLHVRQPIKTKAQGKKAKEESKANLGKGIGDTKGLTVEGQAATAEQKAIAQEALEVAQSLQQPPIVLETVMVALMDESHIGALTGGKNVLEAEGSSGGGADIASTQQEVTNFLSGKGGYGEGGVIGILKKHPTYTPPELATTAQRNAAFLDGGLAAGAAPYARFSSEAKQWVEAFEGGEFSNASITVDEPFKFVVKKKEDFWTAIKRLAKDVNWRAFVVGDKFFYMPEPELFQGQVWLAIDGDTPGIENIDFDYDGVHPVTEATAEAFIAQWSPPPGSVVTLADYGPASIGFGDAPVRKDAKGQKAGLSGNKNVKTDEGRARYLVSSIEVPLDDDLAQRKAQIVLKKPTAPLPEPAAKTKTLSGGVEGSGGTGSKNTLALAKAAFTVKGTTDWNGVTIAKWIYPALLWAKENGGNTDVTSGYRPGVDPHTASGASEHQGDCYASSGEKGAIDFGDFTDPVGKEHRESFLDSLHKGYPGPMLIKATGFSDFGHCSATGS
jgi:hypothetical protein